jgi:predicted DNA-binding mobile mystery protein A
MSSAELAARMAVAQSTISGLEKSETQGTIRLETLRRAAAALDCDVIYYLAPRTTLEEVVREQARKKARAQLAEDALPVHEDQTADDSDRLDELALQFVDTKGLWAD